MSSKDTKVIVFLAFGSEKICNQAILCILTLYFHSQENFAQYRIVIYTDNGSIFTNHLKGIPLTIELLTKQELDRFKGTINYIFRAKVFIIKDCLQKYKQDVIFLDSDVLFTKAPEALFQRISKEVNIMHMNEFDLYEAGNYEDINWLRLRKGIRENTFLIKGKKVEIPFSTRVWNSGVIGTSVANIALLDDILELMDQLYSKAKYYAAEQFAFAYIFQTESSIIPADEYIFHYWPYKHIYNNHIKAFLKNNAGLPLPAKAQKTQEFIDQLHHLPSPEPTFIKNMLKRLQRSANILMHG